MQQRQKRQELLKIAENKLDKLVNATLKGKDTLQGINKIGLRANRVLNRYRVKKYFRVSISGQSFHYERNEKKIAEDAAMDGVSVIRTSVPHHILSAQQIVDAYKTLSLVDRAFQHLKIKEFRNEPINYNFYRRVWSQLFLAMLAYYVEWHMREALAPLLFEDDDKPEGKTLQEFFEDPVRLSQKAERKASAEYMEQGMRLHSLSSLLRNLGTITFNKIMVAGQCFEQITSPTPLQQQVFDLLQTPLR